MNSFQKVTEVLAKPGSFTVGVNYWASHAGTNMWADWHPEVVDRDFKTLAAAGVQVLRVFPLWPDFQPLTMHRGGCGSLSGLLFGEDPLPDTEAGQAGVDETMIRRFEEFAKIAEKHKLSLIVGLVTGWMSGRLFVPPAFENLNVLTDQLAIAWGPLRVRKTLGHGHPQLRTQYGFPTVRDPWSPECMGLSRNSGAATPG